MLTPDNDSHAVLIYSLDNDKFKVKDSYGRKYEIPINHPDCLQVKIHLEILYISYVYLLDQIRIIHIGKAYATGWIT